MKPRTQRQTAVPRSQSGPPTYAELVMALEGAASHIEQRAACPRNPTDPDVLEASWLWGVIDEARSKEG